MGRPEQIKHFAWRRTGGIFSDIQAPTNTIYSFPERSLWGAPPSRWEPVPSSLGVAHVAAYMSQNAPGFSEHLRRNGETHLISCYCKTSRTCFCVTSCVCVERGRSLLEGAAENQKPPQTVVRSGDHRGFGKTQPTHPQRVHREGFHIEYIRINGLKGFCRIYTWPLHEPFLCSGQLQWSLSRFRRLQWRSDRKQQELLELQGTIFHYYCNICPGKPYD